MKQKYIIQGNASNNKVELYILGAIKLLKGNKILIKWLFVNILML